MYAYFARIDMTNVVTRGKTAERSPEV